MAIVEHESCVQVNYSLEDCIEASKNAVEQLYGFEIHKVDTVTNTIFIKSGMSLFSWGELIEIRFKKISDNTVEFSVMSSPKIGMSANASGLLGDMGKNKKNIIKIIDAIAVELEKYPKLEEDKAKSSNEDVFTKIEKLGELMSKNIITQEEFENKKKELLSKI